MKYSLYIIIGMLFLSQHTFAQANENKDDEKPKADNIWQVEVMGSYDKSLADYAIRFGNGFRIGGGVKYKTKKNLVFGGKFLFIVGGKVKEPGLLQNVYTPINGGIINQYGELLNIGVFQRGYMFGFDAGKVFSLKESEPNNGILALSGIGFIQHKINLFDRDNNIPQLKGEYKKGYDRLTNGLYLHQFVGYQHYSGNKLINYFIGLDFTWGFTQGRRDYWFDLAKPGNDKRNDLMFGIHAGWIIPFYNKNAEEIFY
ncbi:MAG: hypothetical protein KA275_01095 [Chitinophagaceae bacterium]|nr:hypothetical protein [Chitinophagaceae bacterium]